MWNLFNCNKNIRIYKNKRDHFIVVLTLLHLGLEYHCSWIFSDLFLECFDYLTTLRFMMVTARWGSTSNVQTRQIKQVWNLLVSSRVTKFNWNKKLIIVSFYNIILECIVIFVVSWQYEIIFSWLTINELSYIHSD